MQLYFQIVWSFLECVSGNKSNTSSVRSTINGNTQIIGYFYNNYNTPPGYEKNSYIFPV